MFGRSTFSDTPFAAEPDTGGDGPVAILGLGILASLPSITLEDILADPTRKGLVFTAEIHPWVLSSR